MGQRQKAAVSAASDFKYKSLVECEENEDQHVVKPTVWPPRRQGGQAGDPSVPLQCRLCGTWCVVYRGHATGQLPGIRVILPEPVAEVVADVAPTRRGGRPKKVVAEVA